MARSAYREAVGSLEQALQALAHLPETRDTCEQAIDLRLALRNALTPSGDQERIVAYLREAERLATALSDPRRLGRVCLFLSFYCTLQGAHDQAIAAGQHACALALAGGDLVLHALATLYLGRAAYAQGDYHRAIDCFRQTGAFFEGVQHRTRYGLPFLPAVTSRAWLTVCHTELGTFAEGRAHGDEGLRMAVAHPASLRSSGLKPPTVRPSPWPRSSACARSRPTATADSARCMPRSASRNKRAPSYPRPSGCTAPWT